MHRKLARGALYFCLLLAQFGMAAEEVIRPETPQPEPYFQMVASSVGDAGLPFVIASTALAQDRAGFLWVGTQAGLARWDGYHFKIYQTQYRKSAALSSDYIFQLHVDQAGRLWAGVLGGGAARYDIGCDCLRRIEGNPDLMSGTTADAFADDGSGGMWIGTFRGLVHLLPDGIHGSRLLASESDGGKLSNTRITSLLRDRQGALWVGTNDGLSWRSPSDTKFSSIPGLSKYSVHSIFESSDGRIWVAPMTVKYW